MTLDCLTTREIAYLLESDIRQVNRRAKREGWTYRPRAGRGGGSDWIIASMPKATRHEIGHASIRKPFRREIDLSSISESPTIPPAISTPSAQPPAISAESPAPVLSNTGHLTAKQRKVMIARRAILNEIERQAWGGVMSKRNVILALEKAWQEGTLDERLRQAAIAANDKTGATTDRGLSYPTMYRWLKAFEKGGELALAPKHSGPVMNAPEWAAAFLSIWQVPSKPSVADAYRQFEDTYTGKLPSIFSVRRFLDKMAKPAREAGRVTGNAMLKLRPYKKRKTDELWAGDIYTADGTTFDAEIQHPRHGQPFKPEVTGVVDVVTRRCLGLSLGESENRFTVLDALRMACCFGGIPCYFYTDNGPGYKNNMMTDEARGILARLDIEMTNAIPGRPQGKGLMERAVQTICVSAAKRFATCSHADMDRDAGKRVFKITRADLKTRGKSKLLPTFEDFKRVILKRVEEYNTTPHRGLPKIVDPATGKRRHMSPDECWISFHERGFIPQAVPETIRDELFMPGEKRTVANGMVQLFSGTYFAKELEDFHGDVVEVRYDIWDSSRVYCWTTRGERICTAELDGNAMDYMPLDQVEVARGRRDKGKVARLIEKINRVAPGAIVQLPEKQPVFTMMADSITPPEPVVIEASTTELILEVAQQAPERRPTFGTSNERYMWLMSNQDRWNPADHSFVEEYVCSDRYAGLHSFYVSQGIAWKQPAQASSE